MVALLNDPVGVPKQQDERVGRTNAELKEESEVLCLFILFLLFIGYCISHLRDLLGRAKKKVSSTKMQYIYIQEKGTLLE